MYKRQLEARAVEGDADRNGDEPRVEEPDVRPDPLRSRPVGEREDDAARARPLAPCLLYTSDAADERSSVDLGGRRIIKKKKKRDRGVAMKVKKKNKQTISMR